MKCKELRSAKHNICSIFSHHCHSNLIFCKTKYIFWEKSDLVSLLMEVNIVVKPTFFIISFFSVGERWHEYYNSSLENDENIWKGFYLPLQAYVCGLKLSVLLYWIGNFRFYIFKIYIYIWRIQINNWLF